MSSVDQGAGNTRHEGLRDMTQTLEFLERRSKFATPLP